MVSYQVYNVENSYLTDLGILNVKGKMKHKELETIIENFIKSNFKEIYHELIELVLINTKTNRREFRFNLVFELDDSNNPIDTTLHPFLENHFESSFTYEFLEAYENTFKEPFITKEPIKISGTIEDVDYFLIESFCSQSEEDCKKYKNNCVECITNKYNLDIVYTR